MHMQNVISKTVKTSSSVVLMKETRMKEHTRLNMMKGSNLTGPATKVKTTYLNNIEVEIDYKHHI